MNPIFLLHVRRDQTVVDVPYEQANSFDALSFLSPLLLSTSPIRTRALGYLFYFFLFYDTVVITEFMVPLVSAMQAGIIQLLHHFYSSKAFPFAVSSLMICPQWSTFERREIN